MKTSVRKNPGLEILFYKVIFQHKKFKKARNNPCKMPLMKTSPSADD